jgi:dipeptidyl aminopeptidase/acylaminoacyl peptidase
MAIRPVVNMLPQPGFFAPCGKQVVIAAGGDRNTTTNKRLVVATFAPGYDRFRVRNLSRNRTRAWVSPTCSPDRTLVAAAAGPDSHNASLIRPRRAIWLLSVEGRTRRQLTRPPAGWSDESPSWTANGKAILFQRQRLGRGLLYVALLDGALVGPLARVSGTVVSSGYALWPVARAPRENLTMVGCTPQPGLGTVTYVRGSVQHRADLATCTDRVVKKGVRTTQPAQGAIVTADGRYSATVRSTGHVLTQRETIWVTDRRSGRSRAVYSAKTQGATSSLTSPGPIMLVRWSGDDRWVFFAIDPGGSGSIVADGLILRVVGARGGQAHRLPVMLVRDDYMTWCGGRLVFTAGDDRVATHHKQLDVTGPPNWRTRPLVRAPGRAWGVVTCAPDQRSVVVQSQPQSTNANFYATRWQLWRVALAGTTTQLTTPPPHHADESPRFSRDGKTILFVRSRQGNGELYALRGGNVTGPLLSLGHQLGYYGHQNWWAAAEWSLAAPTR